MADGVHRAVKEVETPDAAAIRDGVMVESGGESLDDRDHAVLPSRDLGDHNVGCGGFMGTIAINTPHPTNNGPPTRQTGAPPPFRHTLNAQFVTNHGTV